MRCMASKKRIDEGHAQALLNAGATVRAVAEACGVSTQSVYLALRTGRLERPVVAA
jgi:AcrR family transcriptional regulator